MGLSEAPLILSGAKFWSLASIVAPISVSGSMILPIGLRRKLSSPSISEVNLWPANRPLIIRIVEPEFPASSLTGSRLGRYPPSPLPLTTRVPFTRSTSTPSRRTQSRVDWQSTLDPNPVIEDSPSAIEASMATRCEIDLSPGTRIAPRTARGPLILSDFADLDIATSAMLHNDAPCHHLALKLRAVSRA
jgi:hypothetical protein